MLFAVDFDRHCYQAGIDLYYYGIIFGTNINVTKLTPNGTIAPNSTLDADKEAICKDPVRNPS